MGKRKWYDMGREAALGEIGAGNAIRGREARREARREAGRESPPPPVASC